MAPRLAPTFVPCGCCLRSAGADYTLKEVNIFNGENQSADYLAKNPFGKVPTLEVDGTSLYETNVIVEYLDAVVADRKFSPSEPLLQAQMRQIMGIIDSYFYAQAIGTIVIQRLIVPSQGGTPDEASVKDCRCTGTDSGGGDRVLNHWSSLSTGERNRPC